MLSPTSLKSKQISAIERLSTHTETILIAPTGEGKTIICLSAIVERGSGPIIVACPAKVVPVWKKEASKWKHTKHLVVRELIGGPEARFEQLHKPANIYVVSLNNLDWLIRRRHKCVGIIVDELSKASGKQARYLAAKACRKNLAWFVGMTATPVSNDWQKLFGMTKIIDGGAALGTNKHGYLQRYFMSDYMGYNWTLREFAEKAIIKKMGHLLHVIEDKKEETLPPITRKIIQFKMPDATRQYYKEMKKTMISEGVTAANSAVMQAKLRQLASGFMYDDIGEVIKFDRHRVRHARKWVKSLDGARGIIFYEFVEQLTTLVKLIKGSVTLVEDFKAGKGQILLAQINSLSHGVDGLQHIASDALMLHPFWSRDAVEQAEGRLWRTGATKPVRINTIVCEDCVDDLVLDRVEGKGSFMKAFMQHLRT